jgi:uncharacterized protein YehS (DUF1456 family)
MFFLKKVININGTICTYEGINLKRVFINNPSETHRKRNITNNILLQILKVAFFIRFKYRLSIFGCFIIVLF